MKIMSNTDTPKTVLIAGNALKLMGEIAERFTLEGDNPVVIDTSVPVDDLSGTCAGLQGKVGGIDALIFAPTHKVVTASFSAYDERLLWESIDRNSWPLISYTKQIRAVFGAYPKYVFGISTFSQDRYAERLDFTVAAQGLNEVFVKYLNYHLYGEDIVFNMIRTGGDDSQGKEVARVLYAMTSGLMDAIRGQTIVVDAGNGFLPAA